MPMKWREITFDNIHGWPKPAYFLSGLVVFMTLLILGYRFDTRSQLNTLHSNLQKQQTLLKSIEGNQTALQPIDALLSNIQVLESHKDEQIQKMPTTNALPHLLDNFYTIGKPLGLTFYVLKPSHYIKQAGYDILPIHMVVTGHYHAILEWVISMINLQHSMAIKDFDITRTVPKATDFTNPLLKTTLNIEIIMRPNED